MSSIDPQFTPKELIRWDPTLFGTMFYVENKIKAQNDEVLSYVLFGQGLNKTGFLTADGLLTHNSYEFAYEVAILYR